MAELDDNWDPDLSATVDDLASGEDRARVSMALRDNFRGLAPSTADDVDARGGDGGYLISGDEYRERSALIGALGSDVSREELVEAAGMDMADFGWVDDEMTYEEAIEAEDDDDVPW